MSRKLSLKRDQHTLTFLQQLIPAPGTILGLGVRYVLMGSMLRYYAVYATKKNS